MARIEASLNSRELALITINWPEKRNAFDESMISEMHVCIDELEKGDEIRVAIVRSALERVFVAGGDIERMRDVDLVQGARFVYAGHELMRRLERSSIVFIAAVGGFALGGGLELALACDLIVASAVATFGLPETSLGLLPGWGGTQRLARAVGTARAKEFVFTGRRFGAEEAFRIGLVNRVCAPDRLDDEVGQLAAAILANGPMAVARAKRAITEGVKVPLDQGLVIEAETWLANLGSPDRREGLTAFLEKRPPQFATPTGEATFG